MTNDINFARERDWQSTRTLEGYLERMMSIKPEDTSEVRQITTPYFRQCKVELERELQDLKGLPAAERKAKEEKYRFGVRLSTINFNLQMNSAGDALSSVSDHIDAITRSKG